MSADSFVGPVFQAHTRPDTRDDELKSLKSRLNRLERQVIVTMSEESLECRYHGKDFDFLGREFPGGPPRCDSCKRPWRLTQLLIAAGGVAPESDAEAALRAVEAVHHAA